MLSIGGQESLAQFASIFPNSRNFLRLFRISQDVPICVWPVLCFHDCLWLITMRFSLATKFPLPLLTIFAQVHTEPVSESLHVVPPSLPPCHVPSCPDSPPHRSAPPNPPLEGGWGCVLHSQASLLRCKVSWYWLICWSWAMLIKAGGIVLLD